MSPGERRNQRFNLHHSAELSDMARAKRNKPHTPTKAHDRRSRDLPRNAEVAAIEVDDPLALEPGEKIVTLRSIRNDPLARLHTHRLIDEAQYQGGRAFQHDWEKAERGPQAVDPTREYVDGGQKREPITEGQRKAVLRLNRAERELGADGSALVHEVLILGMTMEQIGQRRGLRGQRWIDYFARPLRVEDARERAYEAPRHVRDTRSLALRAYGESIQLQPITL